MEKTKGQLAPVLGIAFDLEGTIVDVEALHHSAHLRAAADVGVNLSWQEALEQLPHFVGGPDQNVAIEIASLANERISAQEVLQAKKLYFKEFLQKRGSIFSRDGFVEVLRWVKILGLKVAIGTVSDRDLALHLLERAGLMQEFSSDVIVARNDVLTPKPSPDVYYETARRIGIESNSQLVFEDSVIGLIAARSAGCRLVAIPTVHKPRFIQSLYREGAEEVFMSWRDPNIREFIQKATGN